MDGTHQHGPKPTIFTTQPTLMINQPFYYSNKEITEIREQMMKLNFTLRRHNRINRIVSMQLKEQEGRNKKQQIMYEDLKRSNMEHNAVYQDIIERLDSGEKEKDIMDQKLSDLTKAQENLVQQLKSLEDTKKEFYSTFREQNSRLKDQEVLYERLLTEQLAQQLRQQELTDNLQVQEIDYEDLRKKVDEIKQDQDENHRRVEEIAHQLSSLLEQQKNQEKLSLELFTQLIQLEAFMSDTFNQLKAMIDGWKKKVNKNEETKS